jgi:tetratricopeptide (TPR) repeat protein
MKRLIPILIVIALLLSAVTVSAQGQPPPSGQQPDDPQQQEPIILASGVFDLASARLQAGEYSRAALDYALLILLNPTFSQAYYGRALSYASLQDFERALADTEIALATAPDNAAYLEGVHTLRAEMHIQREEYDAAVEDYTAIIALNPTPDSYAQRALLRLSLDELDTAYADLTEAIALADQEPVLYFYRGFVSARRERPADAAADMMQFLTLVETRSVDQDEIRPGDLQVVALSQGVNYRIPFQGGEGQIFSAAAGGAQGSDTDPLIVLLDPDGVPLIADDDSGGGTTALILEYALPADGKYTLVVGHSLGGFDGDVGVRIELGSPS